MVLVEEVVENGVEVDVDKASVFCLHDRPSYHGLDLMDLEGLEGLLDMYLVPHQQDPRVVVLLYDLLVFGQLVEVDDEDDDDEDVDDDGDSDDDDDNNDDDEDDDEDDDVDDDYDDDDIEDDGCDDNDDYNDINDNDDNAGTVS